MRTLRRRRDPTRPNRLTITVAVTAADEPLTPGDIASIDDLGGVNILAVRRTDSPEPGLARDERVYALEVESFETSGDVPDIP